MRRLSCFIAVLSALSLPAWAQDAPKTEEPEVTIVVTAERTPQPVSESISSATVITAKEIRDKGARTVGDVLRTVPGVSLRQSGQPGSAATTFIRGAKANQVLVLLDGQRVSSPAFIGGMDLSKFPVTDVSRIEVIRGPVSSLYGSEAIGGVINIITKRPTKSGGNLCLGYGENGRAQQSMSLQGVSDNLAWNFTSDIPEYDGVRPNSDYSATHLSSRIILPSVKGWELTLRGERYSDSLGLPNVDINHNGYADLDDRQWWERDNIDLTASRSIGSGELEFRTYLLNQKLHNNAPGFDYLTNPVVYDTRIAGTSKGTEATYRTERGAHQLIFGAEYRGDIYKDSENGPSPSYQRSTVSNRALYVQDRWGISPKTDVVAGLRMDDHSTAGNKVTPRVGVNHTIAPETRVRLSYAEGFRAPNFVELFYPAGPWGPGYSGNPSLEPEKSRQYELGVNMVRGNDAYDIAVFTTGIRNLIAATSTTPYENIGRARQRGVEFSWDHRFSGPTRLNVTYSYIDAEDRTNNLRLNGIPHNQVSMTLSSMVKLWEVGLTGRWTDKRPDLAFDPITWASSDVILKGRAVLDLSLTRRSAKPTNPYVIVRNLTDADYEEVAGYPTEGRSVEVGMRSAW